MIRIRIEDSSGTLFDFSPEDENVLAPLNKAERVQVFSVLLAALGFMTGATRKAVGETRDR